MIPTSDHLRRRIARMIIFWAVCVYIVLAVVALAHAAAGDEPQANKLPIRATIIQCGSRTEATINCMGGLDECCAFAPVWVIEPAAGGDPAPSSAPPATDGHEATTERAPHGTIIHFE